MCAAVYRRPGAGHPPRLAHGHAAQPSARTRTGARRLGCAIESVTEFHIGRWIGRQDARTLLYNIKRSSILPSS
eukprot:849137-Prymnesium_polylepis.1